MASTAIIPAGKPPPGVTSNFVDPAYDGARFIAISAVFLGLAVIVVVLRAYTRVVIQRSFAADDCKFNVAGKAEIADPLGCRYHGPRVGPLILRISLTLITLWCLMSDLGCRFCQSF